MTGVSSNFKLSFSRFISMPFVTTVGQTLRVPLLSTSQPESPALVATGLRCLWEYTAADRVSLKNASAASLAVTSPAGQMEHDAMAGGCERLVWPLGVKLQIASYLCELTTTLSLI